MAVHLGGVPAEALSSGRPPQVGTWDMIAQPRGSV